MFLDTSSKLALFMLFVIFLNCSGDTQKKEPSGVEPSVKPTELSKTEVKQLDALGYFDRAPTKNPDKRDVTKVEEKAFEGVNLYNSRNRAKAYLIDNNGKVLLVLRPNINEFDYIP